MGYTGFELVCVMKLHSRSLVGLAPKDPCQTTQPPSILPTGASVASSTQTPSSLRSSATFDGSSGRQEAACTSSSGAGAAPGASSQPRPACAPAPSSPTQVGPTWQRGGACASSSQLAP